MELFIKNLLHKLLRTIGIDFVRWNKNPDNTLLGLTKYDISTVLDIGANVGKSARQYRQLFPDALIYCFEPLPHICAELNEWAQTQNGKVKALNMALGDQGGVMTMKEHVDYSPSSSFLVRTQHSTELFPQTSEQKDVQVNIALLDEVAKEMELVPEMLVKMDVQGFEDRVIKGGKETLRKALACILEVSLHPLYEGQPSFMDLCRQMEKLGFQYAGNILQIYDNDGSIVYIDALFKKPELM